MTDQKAFKTAMAICAVVMCVSTADSRADSKRGTAIPKQPELGAQSTEPMPKLGSLSGVGTAMGGIPPKKIVQAVQQSRAGVEPSLRGSPLNPKIAKLSRSVVLIVTPDKLGSGTIIGRDGTILTNWHTLQSLQQVGVIFKPRQDGRALKESDAVQAVVSHIDQVADLALIKISSVPADVVPIAIASPPPRLPGAKVQVISHPFGEIWSHTQGTIKQFRPNYVWQSKDGVTHRADVIRVRTPVMTGNFGGPMLNTKGELVAVDTFNPQNEPLISLGVTSAEVLRLIHLSKFPRAAESQSSVWPKSSKASCEPVRLNTQRTKANDGTGHTLDLNCNGTADAILLVPDNQALPNALSNDANENGVTDSIYLDRERDGRFDEVKFDTDEDGTADLIGYDLDENLSPKRVDVPRN